MDWVVWTAILNGGLGYGALRAADAGFRQPRGWPRLLAAATLGWTWATSGVVALGSIGQFGRGPALAWVIAGVLAAEALRLVRGPNPSPGIQDAPPRWRWEGVVALGLVLWVAAVLGAPALVLPVKVVSDGPIYHLYFAIRWWKSRHLELIATPFGENAATYFPAVGDFWFSWLVMCAGSEQLAKVGQAPFLLLCGAATFALCRRLGAGASAAMVATAWFLTSAPFLLFSFEPNVDTIFIAGLLLGTYFLIRYALRDDGFSALLLSGLALGGALGTKTVGVVFVPPLIVAALVLVLRTESVRSRRIGGVILVAAAPMVMAGYGFLRNALLTGNPLYPLHLTFLGRVWLAGWYGPEVMRTSQYYIPAENWRAFLDILLAVMDARLAPFWIASAAGAWAWGSRERSAEDRWVWSLSGLAALNVALFWLAVPYRTQQRFMLQALGFAAVPLARTFERRRWLATLGLCLLAVHLITPQNWLLGDPNGEPPWDLTPLIPNAYPGLLRLPFDIRGLTSAIGDPATRLGLALMIGLGLVAMGNAWAWSRAGRSGRRGFALATAGSLLLIGLHLIAAAPGATDPRTRFYARFPDYYRGWLELDRRAGPGGVRIAYAGTNLPYYLFGPGLRNEVRYININGHRDWLLHDYHREASRIAGTPATWPRTRPGWDRLEASYEDWLANLRAERIDLLVVARANPAEGPHNVADAEGFTIERVWADAHPEVFTPLYGPAEGDPLFRLYRVRPAEPATRGVPSRTTERPRPAGNLWVLPGILHGIGDRSPHIL